MKTTVVKPTPPELLVPTKTSTSPLKDISDLLNHLPIQACVVLTRRFLTSISPSHRGRRSAGCLEDRHPFRGRIWQHALGGRCGVNPCASPAGMRRECAAGSLSWSIFSASMVSISVDILSETFLKPAQVFQLANYVCHCTDRPTMGGGTAILVRRCTGHHSVPVPGLTHLEATAVQVTLAGRTLKILAACLSPSHPLTGAELTACFGGGLPVMMAGHLNAKHVDWNLRLKKRRGKFLHQYASGNSCLSLNRTLQPPTYTTPRPLPSPWTSL